MASDIKTLGTRGIVTLGLGLGLTFTGGATMAQPALAIEPSVDGTPSNPIVSVDQSKTYAPSDEVTVSVSQTVGDERYTKFILSDVLDSGVLQTSAVPAHVYKVDKDGNKTELDNVGAYTYDSKTKVLSFAFSDDYLKNGMECNGETYVLEYTLKVTDASKIADVTNDAAELTLGVSAASTIAVDGHDPYSKGANEQAIDITTDEKKSDAKDDNENTSPIDAIADWFSNLTADHSGDYDVVSTSSSNNVAASQIASHKSHVISIKQADDSDAGTATDTDTVSEKLKNIKITYNYADKNGDATTELADFSYDKTSYDVEVDKLHSAFGYSVTGLPTGYSWASKDSSIEAEKDSDGNITKATITIYGVDSKDSTNTITQKYVLNFKVKTTTNDDNSGSDSGTTGGTGAGSDNTGGSGDTPVAPEAKTTTLKHTLSLDKTTVDPGGTINGTMVASVDEFGEAVTDGELGFSYDSNVMKLTIDSVKDENGNDVTCKKVSMSVATPGIDGTAYMTGLDSVPFATENTNVTVKFHIDVADTASVAGTSISFTSTSAINNTGVTTQDATIKVNSPSVNGTLTVDNKTPQTGDTVTFTSDAAVTGGNANGVVRTMTIDAPDGCTITASDGGTVSGNTVTWSAESGSDKLKTYTVQVAVPDVASVSGKTIKASGTITGNAIKETTLGGNPTVTIGTNAVTGRVDADKTNMETGDTATFDVSGTVSKGHAKNATVTVNVNAPAGSVITDNGTTITGNTITYTNSSTSKIDSHKITVKVPDDVATAGQSVEATGTITGDNFADAKLSPAKVDIERPTIGGTVTASNLKPSADDTVDIKVTPSVTGNPHGLSTTVKIDGVDSGITADNGVSVNGNVVTFSGKDAKTIHIKLNDDSSMNGKRITATATTTATNASEASLGSVTLDVQTPTVTLKKSATAVSDKASVDGKTVDSDGGTDKVGETTDNTATDDAKESKDGTGDSDTKPIANPDEKKGDPTLVVNNGDEIEYNVEVTQTSPDAHANQVSVTDGLDDYSAENGVYIEKDTLKVTINGNDVTDKATTEWLGDDVDKPTKVKVTVNRLKGNEKMVVSYKVSTGKASNGLLRGRNIENTASVEGTNFESPESVGVTVTIASASLTPTVSTNADTVAVGDKVNYGTVITNSSTDSSSIAKNVYISSAIDGYSASLGVKIDPSTLQILSVENGVATDITDSMNISWNGTTGFSIDTNRNLQASKTKSTKLDMSDNTDARYKDIDHAIVVLYSAMTNGVSADTIGQNAITNTVITKADNATYAVANKEVTLTGADAVTPQDEQAGSISDIDAMSQTGDTIVKVAGGTGIVAVIAGIFYAITRRNKK